MDIYTKYMHHIDNIRSKRNIRVIDFVDGICSDRQYRRYLSSKSVVSQRTIRKFCDRLEISSNDFYNSFHQQDHEEYAKVSRLYDMLNQKEYSKALTLITSLNNHTFLSSMAKKFYQYCNVTYRLNKKEILPPYAIDLYSNLINYPDMLNQAEFNFVDVITLAQIAELESKHTKYQALYKLSELIESKEHVYTSSNTRYIYPSIYIKTIKLFWFKKDIAKAYDLVNNGID